MYREREKDRGKREMMAMRHPAAGRPPSVFAGSSTCER